MVNKLIHRLVMFFFHMYSYAIVPKHTCPNTADTHTHSAHGHVYKCGGLTKCKVSALFYMSYINVTVKSH